MNRNKKYWLIFIMICVCNFFYINNCFGEENIPRVLIIGSYTMDNEWENSVIKGIKELIKDDVIIKTEFLDSKSSYGPDYYDNFVNLLKLKYSNEGIDYLLTIDDEAFNLARKSLFVENSFSYKKPIVFVGVNDSVKLSAEEKEYITGILEYQNNLLNINTILEFDRNTEKIYILRDNSIFSKVIYESFTKAAPIAKDKVTIEDMSATKLSEIKEKVKDIDSENSAIFICGEFQKDGSIKDAKPKEVIDFIKSETRTPIYTNLIQYVEAGAVGGYINVGENVGKAAAELLKRVISTGEIHLILPSYNLLNTPYFNFKAMREYNLYLSSIPQNSIIINRGKLNFLLPKDVEIIIWSVIILLIIIIICLIIITVINKNKIKKNKALLEESEKIDKLKNDICLVMSHEFRTPLNIIINSCDLLKFKTLNDEIEKDFILNSILSIKKNTNRLMRLGNNFIDVNKFTSNHINVKFYNCNIVEVVEDAVMAVVGTAEEHNIEIIFDTEQEEIIMALDKAKIERIILNLLSNSIKFIGKGDSIKVNMFKEEKNVVIEVADNGIGMSEVMQSNIFEKFQKIENEEVLSREYEGSGLGLFIVEECVKIHSGEIYLETEKWKGTKFTIKLPIIMVQDSYQSVNDDLENMAQIELSDLSSIK